MNRQQSRSARNPGRTPAGNPRRGAATAAVEPGVADLLAAGLAHHRAGRLAEAEVHYRRILAAVPDHADALHLLGVIAYQFGRLELAIEWIGRAVQQNGNDPSYYCSCGLVLQGLKRLDEAVASHDRALALKPDYAEALINRGLALEELQRFAEAVESYDRALALRPDCAEALNNRGNTLQALGRFADALESYDRALALRPRLAEAYYNRGGALQGLKRLDEAVASYDRALALKPDYAEALRTRGNSLQALGRFAEALESYDRALALRPHLAEVLNNRGNSLQALGRFAEAVESYDRALALRPHLAEALNNRGNTLQALGRFAEAVESYDRALALRPHLAEAYYNRGNTLQALGRFAEALESYDWALALRPHLAEAYYNRGNALQQLQRFDEALESYDRALALRPDDAAALNNRGNSLQALGRFADALESYDRALALRPRLAEACYNRGLALEELKCFAEALESYDRALALRPHSAETHYNRGIAAAPLLGPQIAERTADLASVAASMSLASGTASSQILVRTTPRIFIHSSLRTSSTWVWSKFRQFPTTACYSEPFHELLRSITRAEAQAIDYKSWDSNHPPCDPYFLEYVPLIRATGGVPLFESAMTFEWFIPLGGLRGELRKSEQRYLGFLIRYAELSSGKLPVFGHTRTLGRLWAIKNTFSGYHIFLYRNLWKQWLAYLYYKRSGNFYFCDIVIRIVCAENDSYLAYLADYYRMRGVQPLANGVHKTGGISEYKATKRLLRLLPEHDAFAMFMALHVYLYLHAGLSADLAMDVTRMTYDDTYRRDIERRLAEATDLPISFSDARQEERPTPADVNVGAINWDEIKEHGRVAVRTLSNFADLEHLSERAAEFIDAACEEARP